MKRSKKPRRSLNFSVGNLILMGMLIFMLASCESLFGPKTEESTDEDETDIARIIVGNGYGQALDIYMDGAFQFTLANDDSEKIRDVTLEEHKMVAKLLGTDTKVDSETIDVVAYTDYSWTIDDPPDINVGNKYGKTLKIYMDGVYQFDLTDEENRWIMNVSMGEHFLKALKASDDEEVGSITLDISENIDYSWVIE